MLSGVESRDAGIHKDINYAKGVASHPFHDSPPLQISPCALAEVLRQQYYYVHRTDWPISACMQMLDMQ